MSIAPRSPAMSQRTGNQFLVREIRSHSTQGMRHRILKPSTAPHDNSSAIGIVVEEQPEAEYELSHGGKEEKGQI